MEERWLAPILRRDRLERHGLSDEQLRAIFRNMLLQRQLDNRGFQLNRQGKVPFALGSEGHEALQAGAAMAFNRGKRHSRAVLSRSRSLLGHRALALRDHALDLRARRRSQRRTSIPESLLVEGRRADVVLVDFGGASSARRRRRLRDQVSRRNRPRRARNLRRRDDERRRMARVDELRGGSQAAVRDARREQRVGDLDAARQADGRSREIWKRAAGYGMPGRRFNGFDPIETYAAVKEAMDRARSGGGPTLVEGTCYRYLAHSTDDNDMTYRTREEVAERRKQDPVPAFEAVLLEHGDRERGGRRGDAQGRLAETNEATDAAEALPYPEASDLYTHVYEGAWQPWQS